MKSINYPLFAYFNCLILVLIGCGFVYTGIIEACNVQLGWSLDAALFRIINNGISMMIGGQVAPWPVSILVGLYLVFNSVTLFLLLTKKCD